MKPCTFNVPFHRPEIGDEEIKAVTEVLRSGWLTTGKRTFEFERRFAEYVGARHAIAVSSGSAALHLSLAAIGIGPGDEVLLPTTTFTATAQAVISLGARPVLVDIDRVTMNISVADAERRITSHTRAIIPVHFGGVPCDMREIRDLAGKHGLRVVEDAAHALPSTYRKQRVGTISEVTAFSFYATKTLTTGEGGMVTTSDGDLAAQIRKMRLHGISRGLDASWRYEVTGTGFKYNLSDLQSALGLAQLAKCDAMHRRRSQIAQRYSQVFGGLGQLEVPADLSDRESSWHLYVLRLNVDRLHIGRDHFMKELETRGVFASVHFIPLHLHSYYQTEFGYRSGDLPVSEGEFERCLSLPIFPGMTQEEIEHVIASVNDVAELWARDRDQEVRSA